MEVDEFDLTVRTPDFNNDNLVDIGDLVKYFTSPPAVGGISTPFSTSQMLTMMNWIDNSRQSANHSPVAIDNLPLSCYWTNPTSPYIYLGCNSYFTDIDEDMLSYKVQSASSGVHAWIMNNSLYIEPTVTASPTNPTPHSVVTVRAYDEHGATADREFTVNEAPKLVHDTALGVTFTSGTSNSFDLNSFFTDYEGQALTYWVDQNTPLNCNYVSLDVNNVLSFNGNNSGESSLDIMATDELNASTVATFTVTFSVYGN